MTTHIEAEAGVHRVLDQSEHPMAEAHQLLASAEDQDAPGLPPGVIEANGKLYMTDAKGNLVPLESVRATDKLMDETVRKIAGYGEKLSAEIARFRAHTFADIDDLTAIFAQEYQTKRGGSKGGKVLTSFDGCLKVVDQVADLVTFGPELQQAKDLVDECLTEWSGDAHANLRAVVSRAFNVDQQGKINRAELLSLKRLVIDDDRWRRAMLAITDAERVLGTKRYVRIYSRPTSDAPWKHVAIDVASA